MLCPPWLSAAARAPAQPHVYGKGIDDMLQMSVDTRAIERGLNGLARSQLPFAIALGINEVAAQVVEAEKIGLARDFDRPAPVTTRGLYISRASKRRLVGVVGFKRVQAGYLERQATGGTRRAKRRAVVVPVNARLNKYGNMAKGSIKRSLAKPEVFSGKVNGVAGVWQRPKGGRSGGAGSRGKRKGLKLLAIYAASVKYDARLKFQPRAYVTARKGIGPAIARNLARAVKTAR